MPRTKQTGYCITDKCYRKAIKRGYCGKHYLKWYRANKGKCMREDCSNVAQSRGLCSRHYQQSLRNKDALVYPTAANCDHPVWKSFTHKFPVCYSNPYWRGKPLWVLDEQENESNDDSDGWFDAPMRDRPSISSESSINEGGVRDWSGGRK